MNSYKVITHLIVILHAVFIENVAGYQSSSSSTRSKLVNSKALPSDPATNDLDNDLNYEEIKLIMPEPKSHRTIISVNSSMPTYVDGSDPQTRFIDYDDDEDVKPQSTEESSKIEPPVTSTESSSLMDMFMGNDADEGSDAEDEEGEGGNGLGDLVAGGEDDDDEDEEEDDVENSDTKVKTGSQDLRQVRRKYTRVHKIIFPLLIAYKLKFFTMVPLLIGSLVLLVGTTGMAGFFFALFAAAMGLHVKSSH